MTAGLANITPHATSSASSMEAAPLSPEKEKVRRIAQLVLAGRADANLQAFQLSIANSKAPNLVLFFEREEFKQRWNTSYHIHFPEFYGHLAKCESAIRQVWNSRKEDLSLEEWQQIYNFCSNGDQKKFPQFLKG
jgi:hypothetical protein